MDPVVLEEDISLFNEENIEHESNVIDRTEFFKLINIVSNGDIVYVKQNMFFTKKKNIIFTIRNAFCRSKVLIFIAKNIYEINGTIDKRKASIVFNINR